MGATVLVELVCEADDPVDRIRDLIPCKDIYGARALWQAIEDGVATSIRDLYAKSVPATQLSEASGQDLRELLERLRRLLDNDDNGRFHLRLAELYFRKGRATVWTDLETIHAQHKRLEQRYRRTKAELNAVYEQARQRVSERGISAHDESRALERLEAVKTMHHEVRGLKREWVMAANALGATREPKTQSEAALEKARLQLIHFLRAPESALASDKRLVRFEGRLARINEELERDNVLYERQKVLNTHLQTKEFALDRLLLKAETQLSKWSLKDQAHLAQKLKIAPLVATLGERAVQVTEMLIRNGADRIGKFEVSALLQEPIAMLESRPSRLQTPDLYRKGDNNVQRTRQIVAYAEAGYSIDLRRVEDPHALAAVVVAFMDSLPEPLLPASFLELAEHASKPTTAQAREIRQLTRSLTKYQRVHLRYLLAHLVLVQDQAARNFMTAQGLAQVFAPVLFRLE